MRNPVLCYMRTTKVQISTFVFHSSDIIIPVVAVYEFSRLKLVSEAEQANLSLTWLETPKTGFLMTRLILLKYHFHMSQLNLCPVGSS